MYKTQMFKKNLHFHYSLGILNIKASEAGITACKDLPMESPASQASCNREYKTGTQDSKEEKDPARMGGEREQVTSTQKPKLGMN